MRTDSFGAAHGPWYTHGYPVRFARPVVSILVAGKLIYTHGEMCSENLLVDEEDLCGLCSYHDHISHKRDRK